MQIRRLSLLVRNLDFPIWRTQLVHRDILPRAAPMGIISLMAKRRYPETRNVQGGSARRGCGGAHNGDITRGRL